MEWYFSKAQKILGRTDFDHFYVSAWLPWAFLYIDPFSDANEGVSRRISSFPLVKSKLPPVVIVQVRKTEYFNALFAADQSGDRTPLAAFLKHEADAAISYISSMKNGKQSD